jgi:hypothetical protein
MFLRLCALACLFLLQACGTMPFTPSVYPLRDGLIPSLPVSGAATISNGQPSKDQAIVYSYGGSKLASNLNAITEIMVQQATDELKKHASSTPGSQQKTIELKVNSLESKYTGLFAWKSQLQFEATLGDGTVIKRDVKHGSGVLAQDLNGCIAEAVITLFNDKQIQDYLAK